MDASKRIKICIFLFATALFIRLSFYFIGTIYLPQNVQKFVTADTTFYYDLIAVERASIGGTQASILTATRAPFLSYLTLFYRYLGHRHFPISVFHCFLSAISVAMLFLSSQLFLKERAAFIIGLTAAFNIVLVYWAPFITTEASFLLIISLCLFLFSLFIKTQKPVYMFFLIGGLILAAVSRPQGITFFIFMLLLLEWLVFKKLFRKRGILYFSILNLIILVCIAALTLNFTKNIDNLLKSDYAQALLRKSLYLDELPETQFNKKSLKAHWARLTIPPGINMPKANAIPAQIMSADILSYFKNHYNKYLALFISKIYTTFNPWVPEYSLRHNIFNVLFYGCIYILSLIGLIQLWRVERNFSILVLLAILSQILVIGLTIIDYDFRLRLPIEFILSIPAGIGINKIWKKRVTMVGTEI